MSEEQQQQKKTDALADALASLAAGDHVEEAPLSGSGMAGQSDHVQLTPTPAPVPPPKPMAPPRPPAITAVPPAVGGGSPKSRPVAGKPIAPPAKPTDPSNSSVARPATSSGRTAAAGTTRPAAGTPAAPSRRPSNPGAPATPPPPPPTARPTTPGAVRPIAPSTSDGGKRPTAPPTAMPKDVARPLTGSPPPPVRSATPIVNKRPVGPGAGAAPNPPVTPTAPPPPPPAPPQPAGAFVVHDDTGSPSEHVPSAHELELAAGADAIAHIVEDDDTLNLPAPGPEAFAPRRPPVRPKRELVSRTVGFKQTLIPILLSQGVLLPLIATYLLVLGEESPLAGHAWIPLSLLGIGLVLLLFAVITMLQVRNQLAKVAGA